MKREKDRECLTFPVVTWCNATDLCTLTTYIYIASSFYNSKLLLVMSSTHTHSCRVGCFLYTILSVSALLFHLHRHFLSDLEIMPPATTVTSHKYILIPHFPTHSVCFQDRTYFFFLIHTSTCSSTDKPNIR